ncbi:MAG: TIGR00341 family protein, partial [Candidatus Eremiobacteraeota bacterium]|nr:TIGR00341 family protein [Candidatus Eremiobacteraeota bacterium]
MLVDRVALAAQVDADVELNRAFLALAAASCAIATLGLLANSVAVIIGAMLIAPLMTPIVAL